MLVVNFVFLVEAAFPSASSFLLVVVLSPQKEAQLVSSSTPFIMVLGSWSPMVIHRLLGSVVEVMFVFGGGVRLVVLLVLAGGLEEGVRPPCRNPSCEGSHG